MSFLALTALAAVGFVALRPQLELRPHFSLSYAGPNVANAPKERGSQAGVRLPRQNLIRQREPASLAASRQENFITLLSHGPGDCFSIAPGHFLSGLVRNAHNSDQRKSMAEVLQYAPAASGAAQ